MRASARLRQTHYRVKEPEQGAIYSTPPFTSRSQTYSQRSHLSSFTMKLMDKFHSPKIKRTPSKKGKPAEVSVKILEKPVNKEATDRFLPEGYPIPLDLEQQAVEFMSTSAVASRSQRQKSLSWLEEKEKEVVSALRYFKTIVDKMAIDKKVLEMLPGSASKVLEAILPLVQSDPRIQHSSALSSCYSRVYQSLANLIRWSDQVMLEGVNSEDKEMVTTVKGVIKAVLDGVKVWAQVPGRPRQGPRAASLLGVCHIRTYGSHSSASLRRTHPDGRKSCQSSSLHRALESTVAGSLSDSVVDLVTDCQAPPWSSCTVCVPTGSAQGASSSASSPALVVIGRFDPGVLVDTCLCSVAFCNPKFFSILSQSELPLTDREVEILNKTAAMSPSAELPLDCADEEAAPPKPPLPGIRVVDNSPPPALPPKKRQSAPSPTRVAIVAPMSRATSGSSLPVGINRQDFDVDCYAQRRLSGGSHSYGGESPRLSPCGSIGKLSRSDEQLSSLDRDSGQCSRNTSCETLDHYDPDYEFLQQDLSNADQIPQQVACNLSPLPESLGESGSSFLGHPFQLPLVSCPQPDGPLAPGQQMDTPPALPEKKRRSAASQTADSSGCRVSYERHPSQYDNVSEGDLQNPAPAGPFTPFAAIPPFQQGGPSASVEFVGDFAVSESTGDPEKPPPLPEKKNKHMLAYMQLLEDYSEPQPSMFYQTPQSEHIYQQKNKHLMEVYGFNDSFSSADAPQDLAPPPALPPKQRQLASYAASSFSSVSYCVQQTKVAFTPEDSSATQGISVSVSNSFLSRHGNFPVPSYKSVFRSYSQDFVPHGQASVQPFLPSTSSSSPRFPPAHQSPSSDLAVPAVAGPPPSTVDGPLSSSRESSSHGNTVCLPSETSFTDSPPTPSSDNASEEAGEGEYVSLCSSGQSSEELADPRGVSNLGLPGACGLAPGLGPASVWPSPPVTSRPGPRSLANPKSPNAPESAQSEEEVDELSLIDHNEIMARLTLKQEGDDGPDVRGGSGDILLVHATETDRKDLVLYCEAFLTTYRTFIAPEELIKKLQYRYEKFSPFADTFKKRVSKNTFFVLVRVVDELCLVELTEEILKLLMELVFRLVCSGELSLARVLRKNILDKVDQKKLLRCANSDQPLAARGVAARPGTLHDFHSHEIAEQLTLLDAELFYKIEIPEVLLWAKEQNEEKSPNLTQFTEHFNNMSYWVRSIIMLQEKAQDRERLLLKFIKIMKHLRKLNNFNSYLAILSALDSAPIRRLEWQKQTSEGLAEYCTLIDSSSSFRAYRAALAEVEPPCIPYLGLILQDLTFVHLGNPDYIDGKVNFSKRWQQFNILDSMRCFQQAHFDIRRNDDIINFFNDFSDHLAEEALWELSLKIKPRNITRRKTDREEKT
ncbi:rap guanine nucleotide exchange factor 1 [Pteropus vampyrus]|uniref:CRK SH3-binding GNRP n=1 Tax=Pteropus vampyrus TaxID=132908 RepID=A0A6P6CZL2_PTEVA|nr:rap guanine nucleotide exchange factor 1 [Pteropus vampyrus]